MIIKISAIILALVLLGACWIVMHPRTERFQTHRFDQGPSANYAQLYGMRS